MTSALVLAGHGSHISPHTAGLIWDHVDRLRTMGVVDEVTAAFWKESPSFHEVLRTLNAADITVIPMFTAHGYFSGTVIPGEMGLTGSLTHREGRIIRYARTLSEHPYLAGIVRQRVEDGLRAAKVHGDQTAVVIIGHSTRRTPESRHATEHQARLIQASGLVREVTAVYLDDDPGIGESYTLTTAPTLIAVPFFLAAGSHTTMDVPEQLGLAPDQKRGEVQGRRVFYTAPVGVEESLTEVVLELAREAGALLYPPHPGSPWDGFPTAGREALIQAVTRTDELNFGQLHLTLESVTVLDTETDPVQTLDSPRALRQRVRQPNSGFRPLASTRDLPGGWQVRFDDPERLQAVVETVYPGVVAAWAEVQEARFIPGNLSDLSMRQTGVFRKLGTLNEETQKELVTSTCGQCICQPTWYDGSISGIPCAEPCNLWMSRALERIESEEEVSQ